MNVLDILLMVQIVGKPQNMATRNYRVVIDTNVIVSALRSRDGASFLLISLLQSGIFDFVLSTPLVLEYEMVLKRNHLVPFTMEEVDAFLDILCLFGKRQKLWYLWRPILADPGDDFIAELAANAQVDFIVTHNRKHFEAMGIFAINVCSPKEFLDLIGK